MKWGKIERKLDGAVWITRSIAFLMRASKGAFSHFDVMRLTWRQFETYLDAFTYLIRQESEDGRQQNAFDDALLLSSDEGFQGEREKAIELSKKFKHLGNRTPKGKGRSLLN